MSRSDRSLVHIGVIVDNEFDNDIRVKKEVDALLEMGFKVWVLCVGFSPNKNEDSAHDNLIIHRIQVKHVFFKLAKALYNFIPLYPYLIQYHTKKFITKYQIDIIHAHDLYMSLPVRKAITQTKRDVHLILDLHENFPLAMLTYDWTQKGLNKFLVRPQKWLQKEPIYLKAADSIITLSQHYKNELLEKYPNLIASRIFIYPNAIDIRRFNSFEIDRSQPKFPGFSFLYFGVVARRRGIFETLEALAKGLQKNQNLHLVVIGPLNNIDKNNFMERIQKPDLKGHVDYISWIDISDLVTYLYRVDACLSPLEVNAQHNSGVANKVYEYMYGAKPIIASNCIPQAELVNNASCGQVYNTRDEYVDALTYLADNPEKAKQLGKNGRKYLLKKFSFESMKKLLLQSYKYQIEALKSKQN